MRQFWAAMQQAGQPPSLNLVLMKARQERGGQTQLTALVNQVARFARTGEIEVATPTTMFCQSAVAFTTAMLERDGAADGPQWFVDVAFAREAPIALDHFALYLQALLTFAQTGDLPSREELQLPT